MAESIWVRTEGGSVIKMDLPLPESIQERLDASQINRVNSDGSPWTGDADSGGSDEPDTDAPDNADDADSDAGDDGTPSPANHAPKSEWIDYAVEVGGMSREDASALTKAELIDRFDNR